MRAVNLIPAEHRGGASVGAGQSQGAAYAVLGILAGIALLAVLYGSAHRQLTSRQGEAARLTAQAQQAQSSAAGLAPYTSFATMRTQRTQAVSTLVDSRFDWAHAFHEFGRVLPLGISISSLEGTVGATTTTGAPVAAQAPAPAAASTSTSTSSSPPAAATASSPASATAPAAAAPVASATPTGSLPAFTISGCATTQREVAVMLERLRLIDGVAAVTLQSSTKGAAAGGASAGATCPASAPVFTAHIEFHPLPAAPAKAGSAATVASTGTAAATSATATTATSTK